MKAKIFLGLSLIALQFFSVNTHAQNTGNSVMQWHYAGNHVYNGNPATYDWVYSILQTDKGD